MKFAAITPTKYLNTLLQTQSSYHMALGQELVRDADYCEFYRGAIYRGDFVMVDNGAAEPEEERVPFGQIAHVAMAIGASEIVMPDVLRESLTTIRKSTDPQWLEIIPPSMRCVVPQGKSWQEWLFCLRSLIDKMEFRTIGVAKHLETLPGGRAVGLQLLHNYAFDKFYDVHMFGIWEKPIAEMNAAHNTSCRIRGIDSGAAVAYAQDELSGGWVLDEYHRSLDWYAGAHPNVIVNNIYTLREAAHHAHRTS